MFLTVYVTKWDTGCQNFLETLRETNFRHRVIDIDENLDIATEKNIKAVPTTQFYDNEGKLLGTKWGVATSEILKSWIAELSK